MKKIILYVLIFLIQIPSISKIKFEFGNKMIDKTVQVLDKNNIEENKKEISSTNIDYTDKQKIIILEKAKELLGKKYVWGAKVGDKNNFDCSSFVKTLYSQIGKNLPRVSRDQSKIGEKISLNELETGDLLFFHTLGNYVSHVGLYIGNNKFVHASSKAQKIIVSDLSGYYLEKFVFGTRLL